MKKLLFIILFLSPFAKAEVDPAWSSLCGSMTKLQALAAQWTIFPTTMPVPPFVGVTLGMVQQNNVILEICDIVQALEKADTLFALDKTKSVLNTMTNNKWMGKLGFDEDQFDFVRDNLFSPDSDSNRGKWIESVAQRESKNISKSMQEYYGDNFNKSAENVSDREREDDRQRKLADSAKNVAVLRETVKCANANDKPNYTKIYIDQIQPQERLQDESQLDIDYFFDQLKNLGTLLASSLGDQERYIYKLQQIKKSGAYMVRSVGKENTSTQTIVTVKGQKTKNQKEITKKFFKFEAKETDSLYTEFKDTYDVAFKKYIRYLYLTDTTKFGIFDGAAQRAENSLRQLSFECSERRLMKGILDSTQDYYSIYEKKKSDCELSLKTTQADSESLFSKYVNELRLALFTNRQAHAKIWGLESEYLGIHRVPINNDKEGVVSQDETSCESNFTQKEIEALKLKIKNEENNLRAQSADSMKKRTDLKVAKERSDKELLEEYKKRKAFEQSTNDFQEKSTNQVMPIAPFRSQIINKK